MKNNKFPIYLKWKEGRRMKLAVDPDETIFRLKANIARIAAINKDYLCLYFASQELDDSRSLEEHGIKRNDTIYAAIWPVKQINDPIVPVYWAFVKTLQKKKA